MWLDFISVKELEMFHTNILSIALSDCDLVFCHYTLSLRKIY
jgi:hypothetical protein